MLRLFAISITRSRRRRADRALAKCRTTAWSAPTQSDGHSPPRFNVERTHRPAHAPRCHGRLQPPTYFFAARRRLQAKISSHHDCDDGAARRGDKKSCSARRRHGLPLLPGINARENNSHSAAQQVGGGTALTYNHHVTNASAARLAIDYDFVISPPPANRRVRRWLKMPTLLRLMGGNVRMGSAMATG